MSDPILYLVVLILLLAFVAHLHYDHPHDGHE